jgi:hypothetical protein
MISLLTASSTIDETLFTTIVNGAKAVAGLFTVFPINVFLAASIMGIGAGVFMKLKHR